MTTLRWNSSGSHGGTWNISHGACFVVVGRNCP